jgi:ribosome-associated heat shock protein Hsp15
MSDKAAGGDKSKRVLVGTATQRVDKWLWFARVVKTRTLAAGLVTDGKVRVNRVRIEKPSHLLRLGDILTLSIGPRIRVLAVLGMGERRGSADQAQMLFEDLTPPRSLDRPDGLLAGSQPGLRDPGAGRPTKRDRRKIDRLRQDDE